MKKVVVLVLFIFILIAAYYLINQRQPLLSPQVKSTSKPKPLLAYTFENLKNTKFSPSQIIPADKVSETEDYITQMFTFEVPQNPGSSEMKKVSGLLNIPKQPGLYPVIVSFRGYAPKETYKSGIGTQPSAKVFAQNGFITLAPDFLGFGQSDNPSSNSFEDRFQTYTTALTLLSSIKTLNNGLEASYSGRIKADIDKVGIWGHSNGGQIALSALTISGLSYPTVLWAPVSTSFPYSILFYTDETDDKGKALRKALAFFEQDYDTESFSPPNFYQWIKAPIQIHQGTADEEVLVWWTDELVENLKKDEIDVKYLKYPGADHNLQPSGWSDAAQSSISFFKSHLK